MHSFAWLALLALFVSFGTPAVAQQGNGSDAVLLVATANLNSSNYRRTVILAVPYSGGRHVGVILNRPTRRTLASLFPEHEPSKKVTEPLFFGGPMSQQAIFSLVRSKESPGAGSIRLLDDLHLALTMKSVDHIIEETPQSARFFFGSVQWSAGELRDEVGEGFWHVLDVDPDVAFRKDTGSLWEELSRLARAIRAEAVGREHAGRALGG